MRKTMVLLAGLVVGASWMAAVRADERTARTEKVSGVNFRAASTTPVEGYDKAALDGKTLYIAPKVLIPGDQVTGVQTQPAEGGVAMSLALTEQAAAKVSGKGAADHVAVFVDNQLITVGALSVRDGTATITGLTQGQVDRVSRLMVRDPTSPSKAAITVVAVSQAKGEYMFDAFVRNTPGLRTYQVKLVATGGDKGSLALSDVRIDEARPDYVFAGNRAVTAADQGGSRLGGTLYEGAVDATAAKYLGTWVFKASPDAAGTFQIKAVTGSDTFLMNSQNQPLPSPASGATLQIGGAKPRMEP